MSFLVSHPNQVEILQIAKGIIIPLTQREFMYNG
jgi:hypothetical protein